jgi:galactofuranose transport system substrate-binding protein
MSHSKDRPPRLRLMLLTVVMVLAVAGLTACGDDDDDAAAPATEESAEPSGDDAGSSSDDPLQATLDWREQGEQASEPWKIAYVMVGLADGYLQRQKAAAEETAERYGIELQVFDSQFNPATQVKLLQDALAADFDGYVIQPASGEAICGMVRNQLIAQDKPVAIFNNPICGDEDYTEGTVGFVGFQTQPYETAITMSAFELCEGECTAAVVSGPPGLDLTNRFKAGVEEAKSAFPNVNVVVDQAADFNPQKALKVAQDALQANPDIDLWSSADDQMTGSIVKAIRDAGKKPEDAIIISEACDSTGTELVASGTIDGSYCALPVQEAEYPIDQMVRFLETGETTPGFVDLCEAPEVVGPDGINPDGSSPESCLLTQENADLWTPLY